MGNNIKNDRENSMAISIFDLVNSTNAADEFEKEKGLLSQTGQPCVTARCTKYIAPL